MTDLLLHEVTHYLRNNGVRPGDAIRVAKTVAGQVVSPRGASPEASALVAAMSSDSTTPTHSKWNDITLKRGITAGSDPVMCKWKGFSLDGKGTDVLSRAEVREIAHRLLAP